MLYPVIMTPVHDTNTKKKKKRVVKGCAFRFPHAFTCDCESPSCQQQKKAHTEERSCSRCHPVQSIPLRRLTTLQLGTYSVCLTLTCEHPPAPRIRSVPHAACDSAKTSLLSLNSHNHRPETKTNTGVCSHTCRRC